MFKILFKKLLVWLTPHYLRKRRWVILTRAVAWPVMQVYNDFLIFMAAKLYRLQHNGQVCLLEKVLNDAFDVLDKRIFITDFDGLERLFFWPEADQRDVNFETTLFFWPDADYSDSGIDFTIHLPIGLLASADELAYLKSLTDEYKLAGKNYNIVYI